MGCDCCKIDTPHVYIKNLKTAVINRLQEVIELINKEDYETLQNKYFDSDLPYGHANFISFSDVTNSLDLNDIGAVIDELDSTRKLNKDKKDSINND